MNPTFEKLRPYLEKQQALNTALTMLSWDTETLAPCGAVERTAKITGILSMELYHATMNEEVRALLEKLAEETGLTPIEAKIVKNLQKQYERMEKIPPKEYQEYSELSAQAGSIWAAAKQNDDFEAFAPCLEKMIAYNKRFAGYRAKEGQSLYDVLLNDYEEGMGIEQLDAFFAKLKEEIVPLLHKIAEKGSLTDKSFLTRSYPIAEQKEFNRFLAEYIGFDFNRGVMAESEHPFTTELHNHDVRITNHYYEHNLENAIFSTIHEGGHALYEQGICDEISETVLGSGTSLGMHESQSRFYENMIGRSEAFWKPIYGKLVETFPEQLSEVPLKQFLQAINTVTPGLVRITADELTYCLHIMIRYELERQFIEGDIPVAELPSRWNRLYEEYLGVTPASYADGVLQDVHWSMGAFGYFPSYAIGNAIAAQIYQKLEQEMDVEEILRVGELFKIKDYLGQHIHQYGMLKNTDELLRELTGEPFCADYYVSYLKNKFTSLYGI